MGFFDFLFGRKPEKSDITAFNYHLFFDFIPKKLHLWEQKKINFQSVISFESLVQKNNIWKSLIKDIEVTNSQLKNCKDITLYLIKAPSTKMMGEVSMAIIAVNQNLKKSEYFTMEYSLGNFAICSADEESNHFYMTECKDGEQFAAYVIKSALEHLVPQNKPEPKQQEYNADRLLKTLEKVADSYYKGRKVVSIEDWLVTQKVGNEFKFYITQYPDAEFEDPNCEVTLMIDVMGDKGRKEIVDKFFPQKHSANQPSAYPNALAETYYSLDQLRQIQMGEIRLQPIDAGIVFDEKQQQMVYAFAEQSPRIKKYLPNLDLSSPEAIAKYFTLLCKKTEMQLEFGYSIKMNKYGDIGYMGFIFVHTPSLNQMSINFPQWTIDFCLFEMFEGKSFMRTSIIRVLETLKNVMGVKNVFAIVDEDNAKCLKFLENLPFDLQPEVLTDPATGHKAKLYRCPLHQINFQRR